MPLAFRNAATSPPTAGPSESGYSSRCGAEREERIGDVGRLLTADELTEEVGLEAHRHDAPSGVGVDAEESCIPEGELLERLAGVGELGVGREAPDLGQDRRSGPARTRAARRPAVGRRPGPRRVRAARRTGPARRSRVGARPVGAQPQPDRPDGDGRGRRREDGDPSEEHVERVVVAESRAPHERAHDRGARRSRGTGPPRSALPADHEPGDRDGEERSATEGDDRHGLAPGRIEWRHARRRPAGHDAMAGQQAPGDRGDEGDAGRHERPPPDGRHDGQASGREERLPDADRPDAPDADERRAGRSRRGPAGSWPPRCRRRRPAPMSPVDGPARPGRTCASRTATAARPYRVIPKIRPTAQELKCGPGDERHRRQEQAGQESEEEGAARRRPGHPPDDRAGQRRRRQQHQRQHDEVAGVERRRAEDA